LFRSSAVLTDKPFFGMFFDVTTSFQV
jgi:hypothetical protein